MKYLFSISFILIYLLGSLQSSWVLIDFYWNREDYTQKYCQFIDEGITQCRASCYLNNLLEEKQNETAKAKIVSSQKVKIVEIVIDEEYTISDLSTGLQSPIGYCPSQYHFDFHALIFHPPKV